MSSHHYTSHLDGDETVRTSRGSNNDAVHVERGTTGFGFVLPHYVDAADRVRFLRDLADAASDLADEINLRDLEVSA